MRVPARLVVASQNPDKVSEVEAVLGSLGLSSRLVRGLSWPEIPETESTLEGNALLKARAVAGFTGLPALADDTGLQVDALGGAPGVNTARFAGPTATYAENVARLLAEMEGIDDRRARFRTVVVLAAHGDEITAEGVLEGSIALHPKGSHGFGYDPIFQVGERTLAQIPEEEKNRVSHRYRALAALAALLEP